MARKLLVLLLMLLVGGCAETGKNYTKDTVPRMSKEELKSRLGAPDLIVLDVRTETDWSESGQMIAGAIREDPGAFDRWAGKYPKDKTLVLYCA